MLEGVTLREVIPGATEVMLCRGEEVLMVRVTGICSLEMFPEDAGCAALSVVTIREESKCGA